MKRTLSLTYLFLSIVFLPNIGHADFVLSISGQIDGSGGTFGGAMLPVGSVFSVNIDLDTSNQDAGIYGINSISWVTQLGTYVTPGPWTEPLRAIQTGAFIRLVKDPEFPGMDQLARINLESVGPALFDDPSTWDGTMTTGSDIVLGASVAFLRKTYLA